jgi:hypothetical protein
MLLCNVTGPWTGACHLVERCIRVNADLLALFVVTLEFHIAVNGRKQRVVAADPHIVAGMEFRAALPDQDAARADILTVAGLDAKSLGL